MARFGFKLREIRQQKKVSQEKLLKELFRS
jgi:hypothetical protein